MAPRGSRPLPWLLGGLAVVALATAGALLLLESGPPAPATPPSLEPPREGRPADPGPETTLPVLEVPDEDARPVAATPAAGVIVGRLLDPAGDPVDGAQVQLLRGATIGLPGALPQERLGVAAASEPDGRFALEDTPAGADLLLHVDARGFSLAEVGPLTVAPGARLDVGDIELDPGVRIVGRVRGPDGEPVAGARVELHRATLRSLTTVAAPAPARTALCDEDGAFAIPHEGRGAFDLLVAAQGYASRIQSEPQHAGDGPERQVTVTLALADELRGSVTSSEDGRPLAGVEVVATPLGKFTFARAAARTDAEGRFRFTELTRGDYSLFVDPAGYVRQRQNVHAAQFDTEVALVCDPAASIRGRVLSPEGEPVTSFDLLAKSQLNRLTAGAPISRARRVRDADGAFEVTDLEPGWYSFEVWAKGYAVTLSEPVRVQRARQTSGLEIVLQPGAVLVGRVEDDRGQGVPGATVSLHPNRTVDIPLLRTGQGDAVWLKAGRTDGQGAFRLADLTAGVFQVQVDHPAHPVVRRDDVAVTAGRSTALEPFVLVRPATLEGTVIGPGGQPLARARVSLGGVGAVGRQTLSDNAGRYRFERLPPGRYQVFASSMQVSLADMPTLMRAAVKHVQDPSPEEFIELAPGQAGVLDVVADA